MSLMIALIMVLITYLSYYYYKRVYLTKQAMESYRRQFEKAGYRVQFIPFRFFSLGAYEQIIEDQTKHRNPYYSLQNRAQSYDVVICSTFNAPMVEFYNIDLVQAFFANNINNYVKFEPFVGNVRRVLGTGMAFSEGDDWKKKRRVISSVFHFDFLNSLVPKIGRIVDETFEQLDSSQPTPQKKPGQLVTFFLEILGNVMMRFFFGGDSIKGKTLDGVGISAFLNKLMKDVNAQGFELPAILFGKRFLELGIRKRDRDVNRRIKLFRDFALQLIKERVAEIQLAAAGGKPFERSGDLIESLYIAKSLNEKTKTDNVYDYLELIEQFCTFFVAGTDTTAHLITMMCVYLERNPAVKSKLMQEIDEIIPSDADLTSDNLKRLHYLQGVINEVGRMYGPGTAIFGRQVVKEHTIKDMIIQKGTLLNLSFLPNNYNPIYYKNPFEFNPQRWLNENNVSVHPFMFIPFSSGQRNCIGQHLAVIEAKLIMVKLMRGYDWTIEKPDEILLTLGFLMNPSEFTTVMRRKREASPDPTL